LRGPAQISLIQLVPGKPELGVMPDLIEAYFRSMGLWAGYWLSVMFVLVHLGLFGFGGFGRLHHFTFNLFLVYLGAIGFSY
jgi:hypothetical protein